MTDRKPSAEATELAESIIHAVAGEPKRVKEVAALIDDFADRHASERGLVHDEPLADSVTGLRDATTGALDNFMLKKAILAAERRGEEQMRERAAEQMDDRATGCRNVAESIQRDWMGPDIPLEDRRANARDRMEHLQRIPLYEALARVIRDLPLTPDPEAGQ